MSEVHQQPIVRVVWDEKYRWKKPDGSSTEGTPEESNERVVRGVYYDDENKLEAVRALESMNRREWCPAGRIHAGAGTDKRVTLLNCFVAPNIEDSMATEEGGASAGIMDALSVAAYTQQMGGGIGMDFSTLRPRGAIVRRTNSTSSGPLPFMDMWHAMCSTVMSSGSRRGAMMATLSCDHPDLEEFVTAKHERGRLTNFNVSVLVTDDFMRAVQADSEWNLGFEVPRADGKHVVTKERDGRPWFVYSRHKAHDLWELITSSTYRYAEPGVIFIDRVNQWNNLWYCEYLHCTNPCGEQPLPPNGDCNLGAVNLAVMVEHPFTDQAVVNWELVRDTTRIGTRFLDNVLDVTQYPTEEQRKEGLSKRRIGLGITGLGNLLQQVCVRYGSEDAVDLTGQIMKVIRDTAYATSVELAKERGPFPLFNRDKYLEGKFVLSLPPLLRERIHENGIRNGVLLTIAPTGTTSIYYGNVSSGLEPTFAWWYRRKMLRSDGTLQEFEDVEDYGYRLYREKFGTGKSKELLAWDSVPDYMVTALELSVEDHLSMQAACQQYVDASISKTINCPEAMLLDEFQNLYWRAYELGLKGCTTYRPSPERGAVLSVSEQEEEEERPPHAQPVVSRPAELDGTTYKIRWPSLDQAFYVTMNDYVSEDGQHHPFEIFINSKSVKHHEWITALTRTISAIFRRGGDVTFLLEELEQVHAGSMGGCWVDGKYVPSLVSMIGSVVRLHFRKIGLVPDEPEEALGERVEEVKRDTVTLVPEAHTVGEICPKCQMPTLYHREGCMTCGNCGYSDCG